MNFEFSFAILLFMRNQYELMLIVKSQTIEEAEKKITELVGKYLKDKGKIASITPLGRKQLVYPIKKERSGNFLLLKLELSGKEVGQLSEKLRLEEDILRYLFIKKEGELKE